MHFVCASVLCMLNLSVYKSSLAAVRTDWWYKYIPISRIWTPNISYHQLQYKLVNIINIYLYQVIRLDTWYGYIFMLMTYIRSPNSWYGYIFIPSISVYCCCCWFILEVETADVGIYLYHQSVCTAAAADLYQKSKRLM